MAKLLKQVKAVSNYTTPVEPVSAPTTTDEPAQANHSAGSNEASGLIGADDLVPAINETAALLIQSEIDQFKESLRHQIELGTLLLRAKASLKAAKQEKWTKWFEAKKFKFSLRKAQRAMRYAKYEETLLAWQKTPELALSANDDYLGVVDADWMIAEFLHHKDIEDMEKAELKELDEAQDELEPTPADPEAAIAALDADELADIISHLEQAKLDQLLVRQLKVTTTSRIFEALLKAWDEQQLANLSEQLSAHLKSH